MKRAPEEKPDGESAAARGSKAGLGMAFQAGVGLILAAAAVTAAVLFLMPMEEALKHTEKGGFVESFSALLAGAGVIAASVKWHRGGGRLWLSISAVLLWMYMRELDYQRQFTPRSVESIGFYSNGAFPLRLKLIALAAMAPFALAGLHLAREAWRYLKAGGLRNRIWRAPAAVLGGLIGAAMLSEKFFSGRAQIIEEVFETAFTGVVFLLVVCAAGRGNQPPRRGGRGEGS